MKKVLPILALGMMSCVSAHAQSGNALKSANKAGFVLTLSEIEYSPDQLKVRSWINLARGNVQYLKGMATFDPLGNATAVANYKCKFKLKVRTDRDGLDAGWIVSFVATDSARQSCRDIPTAVAGAYIPK